MPSVAGRPRRSSSLVAAVPRRGRLHLGDGVQAIAVPGDVAAGRSRPDDLTRQVVALPWPEQATLAAHAPAAAVPRTGLRGDHRLRRPRARVFRASPAVRTPAPRELWARGRGAHPPAVVLDPIAEGRAAKKSVFTRVTPSDQHVYK